MAQGSLLTSFLGALQACVSVLLTLGYGVLTRHFGLIQTSSIHDVSGLGVKVFLPALILVHLGEQLKSDNAMNYLPVLGKYPATRFYSSIRFVSLINLQSGQSSTHPFRFYWVTSLRSSSNSLAGSSRLARLTIRPLSHCSSCSRSRASAVSR
jgi:hypothetical protein